MQAVHAADLRHLCQRADRHHLAKIVARLELPDAVRVDAELRLGLRVNLPSAPEEIKVIHIHRTEIRLQRLADVGHVHAHALGFDAINVHAELRHVRAETGND